MTIWQPGFIPGLSIQQPYSEAILAGAKTIELRSWVTAYRGPIVLHVGQQWYLQQGKTQKDIDQAQNMATATATQLGLSLPVTDYPRGALVGVAQLVKVAHFSREGWERLRQAHRHTGAWSGDQIGWEFADIKRFDHPIPYLGRRGLFPIPLTALPNADVTARHTSVVHCQEQPYDVYVGRPGLWGNPFKVGDFARGDAVDRYDHWLDSQPELLQLLPLLKGRTLGCWCKRGGVDHRCHGDVLARRANAA